MNPMSETTVRFGPGDFGEDRPAINAKKQDLHLQAVEALRLLEQTNHPPEIFRHASSIVRMARDRSGLPVLQVLDEGRMRQILAERLTWYQLDKNEERSPARPPWDLPKNILAFPRDQLPFPTLERVTLRPVFTRDGRLIRTRGYDSETGILCSPLFPKEIRRRPVPDQPNRGQLRWAKDSIGEMFCDFPFTDDSDWAHLVCALLLPIVRDLIKGLTFLHLIEKPSPGTGATLLARVVCYLACGRETAAMTAPQGEAEWRRTLFAKLLQVPEVVLLDNVSSLNSATLSSAITIDYFEDRIVGTSEVRRVPVHCLWLATANNPVLSPELERRCVRIRMDAGVERPHLRKGFRHSKLTKWVVENEARLVWAMLTLVQAWISEDRPPGSKTLGMFESWAEIMGGILDVAGIDGFLDNVYDSNKAPDSESVTWGSLAWRWWSEHKCRRVAVEDLFSIADEILDLGSGNERSRRTTFGKALSKRRDCVFGEYRIRDAGMRQGAQVWKLE